MHKTLFLLHKILVVAIAASAVGLGGVFWFIAASTGRTDLTVWAIPTSRSELHHGVLWLFPLLLVALFVISYRLRRSATRFYDVVLKRENFVVGMGIGIAVSIVVRMIGALPWELKKLGLSYASLLLVATIMIISSLILIGGFFLSLATTKGSIRKEGRWRLIWPTIWRVLGAYMPLYLTIIAATLCLALVPAFPGFALCTMIDAGPGIGEAIRASRLAAVAVPLLTSYEYFVLPALCVFALIHVFILHSFVAGHAFWRAIDQVEEKTGVKWRLSEAPDTPPAGGEEEGLGLPGRSCTVCNAPARSLCPRCDRSFCGTHAPPEERRCASCEVDFRAKMILLGTSFIVLGLSTAFVADQLRPRSFGLVFFATLVLLALPTRLLRNRLRKRFLEQRISPD